jgi:hypothetical protein
MRVSGVFKKQAEIESPVVPAHRKLLWAAIAVLIVAGVVLYFRYNRLMTPLL